MNKNTTIVLGVIIIIVALGVGFYLLFPFNNSEVINTEPIATTTQNTNGVTYRNTDYGFTFSLPASWKGFTVVKTSWSGSALTKTVAPSGVKLFIRNPKWTAGAHYEDIPVLIFTISDWNSYQVGNFSVSAAPIQASELARNNKYVFALPPRWDFDYSLGYEEAQSIVAGKPLHAFTVGSAEVVGKLNINLICEQSLTYMTFTDNVAAEKFVADCKDGKHPEVIEHYKAQLNLGDGAVI